MSVEMISLHVSSRETVMSNRSTKSKLLCIAFIGGFALSSSPFSSIAQTGWVAGPHERVGNPPVNTDFENPVRDGTKNGLPHYRVTVCDDATFGRWEVFKGEADPALVSPASPPPPKDQRPHAAVVPTSGTNGAVEIKGQNAGSATNPGNSNDFDITFRPRGRPAMKVNLTVRVVDCSQPFTPGGPPRGLSVPEPPRGN
jgi:hypothetical protein